MAGHLKRLKYFLIYLRVLACPVPRIPSGELIHQPNSGFCRGIYSLPVGNFWFITTWFHRTEPHHTEPKWWKVSVGKASHNCVPSGLPIPVLSSGSMSITRQSQPPSHHMQPQHPWQHTPLSHLSTDWHWASVWNKHSGASPVSLIQEMGNWTLGCMIHSKAADKLGKTWDPRPLVLGLGDLWERKDLRKLNCIQCWAALRGL